MPATPTRTFADGRDLMLTRLIDAPPEALFRAWTDPELLKQWFAPLPWTVPRVETDVRVGGTISFLMRGPDGKQFPHAGVYLDVVPNQRLVTTDAFTKAWEPSEKPFMVLTVTFEKQDGKTLYTARVAHWTLADREAHEKMGFHEGWTICAEQLAALVEQHVNH